MIRTMIYSVKIVLQWLYVFWLLSVNGLSDVIWYYVSAMFRFTIHFCHQNLGHLQNCHPSHHSLLSSDLNLIIYFSYFKYDTTGGGDDMMGFASPKKMMIKNILMKLLMEDKEDDVKFITNWFSFYFVVTDMQWYFNFLVIEVDQR